MKFEDLCVQSLKVRPWKYSDEKISVDMEVYDLYRLLDQIKPKDLIDYLKVMEMNENRDYSCQG